VQTMIETVGRSHERDYRALLEQALTHTAEVVAEQARSGTSLMGMGTTLAVALVAGRRLYAAYVGDSRLYLIRNQTIRQISVDHTWVQEAIEHRLITREEAKQHPNRHVVRRHLGGRPDVPADFRLRLSDSESPAQSERNQGLRLHPGEAVLLCSDGLSDLVEEEEILSAFNPHDPQGTVEALIVLARARGGHDNITVVILQVPPTP
ncbi:MAG: PP2C family protein-serine/threonine phosphatase, partial [Anaerolineales bacterium]